MKMYNSAEMQLAAENWLHVRELISNVWKLRVV